MWRLEVLIGSLPLALLGLAGMALLAQSTRLPLTEVPLKLAGNVKLGTVSSIASGPEGVVYILQRGDQADPVIVLRTDGTVVRSWGRGLFSQPHSIRFDPQGNVWTVDAGAAKGGHAALCEKLLNRGAAVNGVTGSDRVTR